MKILIVGGGVAGTALAGFLKGQADVTLIDKAPQWGDIGYAITLWGNGRKMLRELGAEHDVLKESYEVPWNVFEDQKGGILKQFTFGLFEPYGATIVATRTTLHKALIKTLGNTNVRLGTTVTSLSQDKEKATAFFSDGTTDSFDLVVGADGIHSQIREMVFGKQYLKYYGWHIWAFWTPKGLSSPRGAIELSTGGKMYFEYPMEDKAVLILALKAEPGFPDPPETRSERLHQAFKEFNPTVEKMISAIEDPGKIFHDDLSYVEMNEWYRGRVVLLGDAQHATSPITGMGASMAMEDAFVLAAELKNVAPENVPLALKKFSKRRGKRVKKLREASHSVQNWMMVKSQALCVLRDFAIRFVPTKYFTNQIVKLLKEAI